MKGDVNFVSVSYGTNYRYQLEFLDIYTTYTNRKYRRNYLYMEKLRKRL